MKPYSKRCTTKAQKTARSMLRRWSDLLTKYQLINIHDLSTAARQQQLAAEIGIIKRCIEILTTANTDSECVEALHMTVSLANAHVRELEEGRWSLH